MAYTPEFCGVERYNTEKKMMSVRAIGKLYVEVLLDITLEVQGCPSWLQR
jgi:hypothetical protein